MHTVRSLLKRILSLVNLLLLHRELSVLIPCYVRMMLFRRENGYCCVLKILFILLFINIDYSSHGKYTAQIFVSEK